jgi:hypothetical protein
MELEVGRFWRDQKIRAQARSGLLFEKRESLTKGILPRWGDVRLAERQARVQFEADILLVPFSTTLPPAQKHPSHLGAIGSHLAYATMLEGSRQRQGIQR